MDLLPVLDTYYAMKWSAIALEAKTAWKSVLSKMEHYLKIINIFYHSIFPKEKYTNPAI